MTARYSRHSYDVTVLAAVYDRTGPSHEVLRVEEIPTPEPGPGEVRVRVRLSAVNPTDWKSRARTATIPDTGFQIPNQDGVGTIDAVGQGVEPGRLGERVWLYFCAWQRPWGSAAQYTVVPSEQAVPLPDDTSDELGASMGIPGLTAHRCLFADGPLAGKTVLVHGGAGAVGHFAIELAKWRGARVASTVSNDEKAELARQAGADVVVNYREGNPAEQLPKVDRIVDVAINHNLPLNLEVLAANAVVSAYANGTLETVPVRDLMTRNILLRFVLVYTVPREALRQAVDEVSEALRAHVLTELPSHRFPLDQIADAHDAVENGAVGKVFVEIP
jgi:NADPH:quinone reductase